MKRRKHCNESSAEDVYSVTVAGFMESEEPQDADTHDYRSGGAFRLKKLHLPTSDTLMLGCGFALIVEGQPPEGAGEGFYVTNSIFDRI